MVCEQGHVDLEVEFNPRPEYGRTRPLLCETDHGVTTRGEPDALTLTTDVACPSSMPRSSYRYRSVGLLGQRALSGGGAVVAGLISTGVGEATLPGLVRRSGFPLPVAAATSTVVVAATVAGAALTHLVELGRQGGFSASPWNLLVWAVPGAIIGAFIGTFLQDRIPERITRLLFAGLFGIIGLVFLAVFGFGVGAESLA